IHGREYIFIRDRRQAGRRGGRRPVDDQEGRRRGGPIRTRGRGSARAGGGTDGRLAREERHHLARETTQRLEPSGGVEQEGLATQVAQLLDLGDDVVGRPVEGALLGRLGGDGVRHDARLVQPVRALG